LSCYNLAKAQHDLTNAINAAGLHVTATLQNNQIKRLAATSAKSAKRLANDHAAAVKNIDPSESFQATNRALKPKSMASGMRKAGIALIAAPDPITGVPGVALLASSYVVKKKEAAGLEQLARETRKMMRDLQSLRL
jgi:hypothetical protein